MRWMISGLIKSLLTIVLIISIDAVIIGGVAVLKWELVKLLEMDIPKTEKKFKDFIYNYRMKKEIKNIKERR